MPSSTRPPKRTQRTPSSSHARSASPGALPSNVVAVDGALAGDDEVGRRGALAEAERVEHIGRAGDELGAERRERGAEAAGGARSGELGERLQRGRRSAARAPPTSSASAPFCGPNRRGASRERRARVAERPSSAPAARRAPRAGPRRRPSSPCRRGRRAAAGTARTRAISSPRPRLEAARTSSRAGSSGIALRALDDGRPVRERPHRRLARAAERVVHPLAPRRPRAPSSSAVPSPPSASGTLRPRRPRARSPRASAAAASRAERTPLRLAGHASARTGLASRAASASPRPRRGTSASSAPGIRRSIANESPSRARNISPTPTPTDASIACSPNPNAIAVPRGDAVASASGSAIAACRRPMFPGQSGKSVATFISSSTSAGGRQRRVDVEGAHRRRRPRGAGRASRRHWKNAATAAGPGARSTPSPCGAIVDEPPDRRRASSSTDCWCWRALANANAKRPNPTAPTTMQARDRPVRDLRREQRRRAISADRRHEVEEPVGEDGPDERRPDAARAPLQAQLAGQHRHARELADPARQHGVREEADRERGEDERIARDAAAASPA